MSAPEPATSSTNLINLIIALLAPMFLWSTAGDIRLAHIAAAQTLNEYRVTNRLSLFTVAKIIAFDIATLSSLSLSMYEEVSTLLALRLRNNANSLDRSGARARRMLEQEGRTGAPGEPIEVPIAQAEQFGRHAEARMADASADARAPAATPAPSVAAPAAPSPSEHPQPAWPGAVTALAEEFAAGLEHVPADEQWKEMARIMALTEAAADIASGAAQPPAPAMAGQ